MLANLSIENYALIDSLKVGFDSGFTVITGETGAGKSILLGGLSLVLGNRADLSSLRNKDKKCIVEADFTIKDYNLKSFFSKADLDYEDSTVIRREILPSGKSRAFINDTPVTLDVLSRLGARLIDVHSQHQTLRLTENDFQFKLIDALANNKSRLTAYKELLQNFTKTEKELQALVEFQSSATKEQDYNSFLLTELEAAPLKEGVLEELEVQYEQLNNVELIMEELSKGDQLFNDEQAGVLPLMTERRAACSKLAGFGNQYEELYNLENDHGETTNLVDDNSCGDTLIELKHELECWFAKYTDPDLDGRSKAVSGRGQFNWAGKRANSKSSFCQ